ncbi:phage holin family protein [Enterococcus canintestini]|uniref:Holin n=1 Tax=Enterococcus canintestini TaxID=317010 RepID=A0A267HS11_9ENTE|nr:phage holin family protein [Enterococcus canintestini]PAB00425.1 holin [Enterococcus canintestini]
MYQQFWQFLVFLQGTGIFNVVAVLAVAMIFDFFSGMLVATWTKTISSRIGINGIIRKLASMFLLLFFIPVAFILPASTGVAMLWVFYLGYLWLEIESILENYRKLGIDTTIFKKFLAELKKRK